MLWAGHTAFIRRMVQVALNQIGGPHSIAALRCQRPQELTEFIWYQEKVCCGFGGTFAAKFPMISTAMGEVKCAGAAETGAEYIVSNDSSCLMQIQGVLDRQGSRLKTIHLAEVLAQS